ncbi:MAG: TIGR04255 family protein [Planctomycetota bacterium]|nr:TIGR04255 family protein [Planctomycetota bacterium]
MKTDVTFKHPPVIETVLSIQFERLPELTNAHLGAFWQQRKSEWPQANDAPPLEEQFETFGKQTGWQKGIHLKITQAPAARLQMKNATGDRMIQLQNCRLDYNWIGQSKQKYPRYNTVRPEFDKILIAFEELVTEHRLGDLVPNQWEVTYVNHIFKGEIWSNSEDWASLFKLPGLAVVPEGLRFEGFGGHWHFEIEPQRGRLHVAIQQALVGDPEKKEALVMNLTARGPIANNQNAITAIDEGLNLGHDVIVKSFRDLTSQQAHDYWNRENHDADI